MNRFSDFQCRVGAASNILARTLAEFVVNEIMVANACGSRLDHREYHLTEKDLDLTPVIIALTTLAC